MKQCVIQGCLNKRIEKNFCFDHIKQMDKKCPTCKKEFIGQECIKCSIRLKISIT